MSGAHARLSPSGAKRWMACSGSITLSEPFPDESSSFADDGTACHAVAAECLVDPAKNPTDFAGRQITVSE